jgi:polar amino acid transport system permease protein
MATAYKKFSRRLKAIARRVAWWQVALVGVFGLALLSVARSESDQDILYALFDRPQLTSDDKFDVVYTAQLEVLVLGEAFLVRRPDGRTESIADERLLSRERGTLACDKVKNPTCLDEFGDLATYQAPAPFNATPDGRRERVGVLLPVGGLVQFPDGEVYVPAPDELGESLGTGTLACNRLLDADCQDLNGELVTVNYPYVAVQGLVTRHDVLIRHLDGFEEVVRANALSERTSRPCVGAEVTSPYCFQGAVEVASLRERIVGVEVGRKAGRIQVRTVNEQTTFVPAERILSRQTGRVACNREANPRCNDFEGLIVEERGALIVGQLTLESNRALNIIPDGESKAREIRKSEVVSDTRTPPNCRVEDKGDCRIEARLQDRTVGGVLLAETDEGLLLQTVAPVILDFEREGVQTTRRAPLTCSLNNLRGCNAGIWLTLLVTVSAYSLALVVGLLVGMMRVSSNPLLHHAATFYVEVVRGLPLLVILLLFAFVVSPLIRDTETLFGLPVGWLLQPPYDFMNRIEVAVLGEESFLGEAVLGLAIGYGAFLAEVFRAGIQAIGRGQIEAARSLGMGYWLTMRQIVLPQALRLVLPPLGNDFIAMLKDSALITVLALPDLLHEGRLYITRTLQPIPVYLMVALIYVGLTLVLSAGVRRLERRLALPR